MAGEQRKRVDRGIYQLGKNRFEVVVSRGWDPVKKRYGQKSERVNGTLTEARQVRARLLIEAKSGVHTGATVTLDEAFDAWLAELERMGRAPKTLASYRADAGKHWRPVLGDEQLRKITRGHLQAVVNDLVDAGLSPATIDHVHAAVSGAFSHAMREDWITRDPSKLVKVPSIPSRRPKVPTPEEVVLLIKAAAVSAHPWMARYIWLGAVTGARPGELRALRLGALHLEEGWVGIEHAISDGVLWETKNRKQRDVGLDEITVAVVADQVAFMRDRAGELKLELPEEAYVFSHDVLGGRPVNESWASHFVTELTKTLGLAFSMKHLRKFMDTYGQDLGFTLAAVASRGGHLQSTADRHYTGKVDATDRELSAGLAALLNPEGLGFRAA